DAGVGGDAGQRPRVHGQRLLGGHLPGPGDPADGADDQPDGRWPARRAGPQAEALLGQRRHGHINRRNLLMALLEIEGLDVRFHTASGLFAAVEDASLSVDKGDVLAIVGESGSGKSVSMLATMGLLPWTA